MGVLRQLLAFLFPEKGRNAATDHSKVIDIAVLSESIEYPIRNPEFFFQALSHRSYIMIPGNESQPSNERLEFLGDAILNLIVAEFLYHKYETAPEGELTKVRARLVNRKSLNAYARNIRLEQFILTSPGVNRLGDRGMENLLADAFEAIIAAIYLDGGFSSARNFVQQQVLNALEEGAVNVEDENFKSQLLEYAQGAAMGVPRYSIIREEGPDHDRTFTIEVYLKGEPHGVGMGKNKKDAEQAAAEQALHKLHIA